MSARRERAKVLEAAKGVTKVRFTWRDTAVKGFSAGAPRGTLLSLHTHGYNILMKERPDRAKCPRRLALPNCSVPRPSGGIPTPPGSEHARAAIPPRPPPPCIIVLPLFIRDLRARGLSRRQMARPTVMLQGAGTDASGCCAAIWWEPSGSPAVRTIH